jgi:uncharacterized protein (DUF1330 family)
MARSKSKRNIVSAYMIVYAAVKDRKKFMHDYAPVASRLVEKFGGHYMLRAPAAEVIEGDRQSGLSVVISEWPDKESILRFWNSPEYQEAKQLREGIADCEVTIVEAPSG